MSGKSRIRWVWLALLLPALAGGQESVTDQLRFYAQWNDDYFYFGAKCEDINLVGTRSGLNQQVWLDDDLELLLQRGGEASDKLTENAFWLAMSAANGISFRRGDPVSGDWLVASPMAPGTPFRQSVKLHGTLNDPADQDEGWVVELALPWKAMGVDPPQPNEIWRFNVVRHLRGEIDARWSYSEAALPLTAQFQPNKWLPLVFRGNKQGDDGWLEPEDRRTVICPRVDEAGAKQVLINGILQPGEWPELYRIDVQVGPGTLLPVTHEPFTGPPVEPLPLPAGSTFEPREVAPPRPRGFLGVERLLLATYRLDYQDDPRRPGVPRFGARDASGASLLGTQPLDGLGPWFSSLRVAWHQQQLTDAARSQIDFLLTRFPGDRETQAAWSRDAVLSLVTAQRELADQRKPAPALAPLIPIEALQRELGGQLDFTQPVSQEALYRMIRDFYRLVPPEFRAQVSDDGDALVVALTDPSRELRVAPAMLDYCESAFREEFGLNLVWLGSALWGRRGVTLDGYLDLDASRAPLAMISARLPVGSLGPGYNDARSTRGGTIVPRRGVQQFRSQLQAVVQQPVRWLFADSWNDYRSGDNFAPSRNYGSSHQEALRIGAMQFSSPGESPWVAKLRRVALPSTLVAGETLQVPVKLFNAGIRPWEYADDVRLSYRWYSAEPKPVLGPDGKPAVDAQGRPINRLEIVAEVTPYSEVIAPVGLPEAEAVVPVAAVDDQGRPLPPGRYRLIFDAFAGFNEATRTISGDDGKPVLDEHGKPKQEKVRLPNWLSLRGDPTFDLPIEIVPPEQAPEFRGSVLSASAPARGEAGRAYPVAVRVRNEGIEVWDETVSLVARFRRVRSAGPYERAASPESVGDWVSLGSLIENVNRRRRAAAEAAGVEPDQVQTIEELAAGELLEVPVELSLTAGGARLPDGDYEVEYALRRGGANLPSEREYRRWLRVGTGLGEVAFGRVAVPDLAQGNEEIGCRVQLLNLGFETWPAERTRLVWHWYYWDGVEQNYDAGALPLPEAVEPGKTADLTVNVVAPSRPGPYYLLFDVIHPDGSHALERPSTTAQDSVPKPVLVVRGELQPFDLGQTFNIVGVSTDLDRESGDFDGKGNSLPAEAVPPGVDDISQGLYPSGYLEPIGGVVPDWQRSVAFWYANPQRKLTAIRPDGQTIRIWPAKYQRFHVLAAAIDEDVTYALQALRDKGEPLELGPVTITSWNRPPAHGELRGFHTAYRRGKFLDDPTKPCYLHHLVIPVDSGDTIEALRLPADSRVRILAITGELTPTPELGPRPAGG